jgi:hypothetical protein
VPARQLALVTGTDVAAAHPGSALTLVTDITPATGMHVYAPGADGYLPVELTLDEPSLAIEPPASRPDPVRKYLTAVNESAPVYQGRFQMTQPVRMPSAAASSGTSWTVTGVVKYQACDDRVCYRPEAVKVTWTVKINRDSGGS